MNLHVSGSPIEAKAARVTTVVISMPSATARRKSTSEMLSGSGLEWSYFDAHTSLLCEELRYDETLARTRFGRTLARSEIAVCSSHYAVWKAFLEKGESDYLLVLEDDVLLDVDFPVGEFADFCGRHGIDYVRLFGKHYAHAVHIGFFYDRSLVRFSTTPAGAQAYILSIAGATRLTEGCRMIDATIDLVMDRFWETGMPIYSIFPYPAIERYSPTSIPIPAGRGGAVSRAERWTWHLHRAVNKLRKIRANRRLAAVDDRMRGQMPVFEQIYEPKR